MIIVPDTSSDDEYWCSSCSSVNDSELLSLDTRKLWHDIAHIIKCIYRETNREFAGRYYYYLITFMIYLRIRFYLESMQTVARIE
jgi:hypothetical protein